MNNFVKSDNLLVRASLGSAFEKTENKKDLVYVFVLYSIYVQYMETMYPHAKVLSAREYVQHLKRLGIDVKQTGASRLRGVRGIKRIDDPTLLSMELDSTNIRWNPKFNMVISNTTREKIKKRIAKKTS